MTYLWKNLNLKVLKKKINALQALWVTRIDTFFIKLNQFETIGSINKVFYSAGKIDNRIVFFEIRRQSHIFADLYSFAGQ